MGGRRRYLDYMPAGSGIAEQAPRTGFLARDHFLKSPADFLFADCFPSRAPAAGSRYFPDKGSVVLRSGDTMLLYRAGPNFNHNHADQGSFLLRAGGEDLVTEAGYSDYYKDPYYDSYFKQAIGHNTVLVDGDPESQEVADNTTLRALEQRPRITDVLLSPAVDALTSELDAVYRGRLRRFERRVLLIKPEDVILIYDDLAAQAPARFDWLLHLPDRDGLQTKDASAFYQGSKSALVVQRLFPGNASFQVENGHLPFAVFNPAAPASLPRQPAILKLSANAASGRGRFLVALSPAHLGGDFRWDAPSLQPVENPDWTVAERLSSHQELRIRFRKEPSRSEATDGPWSSNASVWMVSLGIPNGRMELLAGQGATILRRSGHLLFSATLPVSFAAEYREGEIRLTVNAPAAGRIRIARADGSLAEGEIAAGQQELTIR